MEYTVQTHTFSSFEIPEKEVLRYAGIKGGSLPDTIKNDISECILEVKKNASPKACFMRVPIENNGFTLDFGIFKAESKKLAANLKDCHSAFLFAVTLGTKTDMLITRYSSVNPVKALYFQAAGAAAAENLCDIMCDNILKKLILENQFLRPRFSPGYGDFSISYQKEFLNILDTQRKIGLYITDGGFMVPSKSVTAIVGISNEKTDTKKDCLICENKNCEFRKSERK